MSFAKLFGTDKDTEKNGVRITYGENANGKEIAIIVARAGGANEAFQRTADVVLKPYRRQIQTETIDQKKLRSLMMVVYARSVVRGWEGVLDDAGKEIPFSEDACVAQFEAFPDLFADVQSNADQLAVFRKEDLAKEAKN